MRGDGPVERGAGRLGRRERRRVVHLGSVAAAEPLAQEVAEAAGQRLRDQIGQGAQAAVPGGRGQLADHPQVLTQELLRPAQVLAHRDLQQLVVGRDGLGVPGGGDAGRADVGVGVEQEGEHERARRAVDGGVVDLGELRDVPALEALDDVELPQRPAAVERAGHDAGHRLGQLLERPRRSHGVVPDVEVDVEVVVLHPVGEIQAERHLDQAAAERRQLVHPLQDDLLGDLQAGAAGRGAGVVDVQRRHVAEDRRRLHVEEADVDAAQLTHADIVRRPARAGCGPCRPW